MSTYPQSDDPNYPSSSGFYSDLYGSLLPDPQTLYSMARNSYVSPQTPEKMIDIPTYKVVLKTPTLTIYADNFFDSFVVAIRGTADYTDFKAWLPTATSAVTLTDRWQKDYNDLSQFQKQYPTTKYKYYGVGHSLGGTIMDQFIKKGMIDSGRSYNPAINLGDIPDAGLAEKNARIYASGDPLYNLEGRLDHPTEVRPSPPVGWIGAFLRAKEQHSLLNPLFKGGGDPSKQGIYNPIMDDFRRDFPFAPAVPLPAPPAWMPPPNDPFWQGNAPPLEDDDDAVGGSQPLDRALYERAKATVYPRYKKPSAYRSGALIKEYKRLGGRFKEDGGRPLERWFQEEWQDIGNKDYPVYRPTKRITKDTPLTASEIDPADARRKIKEKQKIKGDYNLSAFKKKK